MNSTVIGVDLAKSVLQVGVSRHPGQMAESHRLVPAKFLSFMAQRESAVVVMEACGTAHYWARELETIGHRPVLLPPHAVRPYVPRNKTDQADTKALLEAYRNREIHPVPIKSLFQQDLALLHRQRSAWMEARTGVINRVRAALRERGWPIPVGANKVVPRALELLHDPARVELAGVRLSLLRNLEQIRQYEQWAEEATQQLKAVAKQLPLCERLMSIPGIGLLSATALVAFVGDMPRFKDGRHFASYLGLTPREHSSGLKRQLGGITKQGDKYLRMLLIHGARAVLLAAKRYQEPDRLRSWALRLQQLRGHNVAAVGLANKLARIVWAVWKNGTTFESRPGPAVVEA